MNNKMQPVFLEGKNIFLGPLSKEGKLDNYVKWLNDQDTMLFMGGRQNNVKNNVL
jgi:hypothetical protein